MRPWDLKWQHCSRPTTLRHHHELMELTFHVNVNFASKQSTNTRVKCTELKNLPKCTHYSCGDMSIDIRKKFCQSKISYLRRRFQSEMKDPHNRIFIKKKALTKIPEFLVACKLRLDLSLCSFRFCNFKKKKTVVRSDTFASNLKSRSMLAALISRWIILGWPANMGRNY